MGHITGTWEAVWQYLKKLPHKSDSTGVTLLKRNNEIRNHTKTYMQLLTLLIKATD